MKFRTELVLPKIKSTLQLRVCNKNNFLCVTTIPLSFNLSFLQFARADNCYFKAGNIIKSCQKAISIHGHDHHVWFYYRKQKQQSTTFFEQKSTDLDPISDDYFGSFYVMTTSSIVVTATFHHVIYGYVTIRL